MSPASRRFYQRYSLLTTLLPAVLASLLCFVTRYWSSQHSIQDSRPLYFLFGGLFLLAAAGGMPFLASLGFRLSGLPARARSITPEEKEAAQGAFDPSGSLNRDIEVRVLELDELPFLAASSGRPDLLWVSRQVLTTPTEQLHCLILHERAHLAARGWFDDLFAHWAYFTVASSAAALPLNWPLRIGLLVITPWLLLRLKLVWTASREREADRLAAEAAGLDVYSRSMAAYLAAFESPAGSQRLRLSRLLGMGLSRADALDLIES